MQALPGLSHRELPPAIGLVLKLAATDDATCRTALAAVRLRVNALDAASSSAAGAIDALRLSVVQHPVVARAALATFKEECRAAASCDGATADGAPQLSLADTHVMLDCLSMPSLRDEGVKTLDACVSAGRVDSTVIADCMEQRNTARALHIDPSNAEQPSEPANAPEAGGAEADAAAKRTPVVSSVAQQIFIAAHPVNDGFMPAEGLAPATASQLQLHFSDNASPSGLPPLALSASADELGGALAAAESLLKAKGPGCQGIGAALFVAAFKYCPPTHQLRVLQSLVHLAISGPGGPAVCTAAVLSAAKGLNPTADVTNALPSTAASAAQVASFLLSYLTTLFPDNSEMIIRVLLESAATAAQQVQATKQSMATAAQEHAQQLAAERSAATKAKAEARRAAEQLSELETQVARQRAEYQAELAGAASDRKEMQAQLRAAEQQVEWVRSERDEERAVRARESKEAAQRVAEAEAQLARLKATRRDELKRSQKDRAALLDRARELEESAEAAQAEATRLRSESSRMEKAVADARRRAEGAERSLASKDGEIASLRAAIAERDAQLRVSAEAQQRLQQMLAGEQQRMAMLAGASGLPNHLGQLSPTGKGPYRQVGPMQQPGQPQQAQQGPPGMGAHGMASLSAAGSLDSLHSLQGGAPGPSGSLFSGGSWGLGNHSAGAPRQSSAPAPGQDDSANMEKLLGLLPSDLLHS